MVVRIIAPPEKMFFNHKWPFVRRGPFAPGITLWEYDAFDHQIPDLILLSSDLLVKCFDHSLLVRLTMTNSSKSLLVD